MSIDEHGIPGGREFPTTSWSLIVNARDPNSPDRERYLRKLIELYWKPAYRVIRSAWGKGHQDAKDLTQEFFATAVLGRALVESFEPERGSFRTYLRVALTSFLRNADRDASRQKRGGDLEFISFEDAGFDSEALATSTTVENGFDEAWKEVVLEQAVAALETKLAAEGKQTVFEIFRRYELTNESGAPSRSSLAEETGLSVRQVKHALEYSRRALRDIVQGIIRDYVSEPTELAEELHELFAPRSRVDGGRPRH